MLVLSQRSGTIVRGTRMAEFFRLQSGEYVKADKQSLSLLNRDSLLSEKEQLEKEVRAVEEIDDKKLLEWARKNYPFSEEYRIAQLHKRKLQEIDADLGGIDGS